MLAITLVAVACESKEDKARAEFQTRLKRQTRLTREDIAHLYDEIGRALAGKRLQARQGAVTRDFDDRQRAAILGMLSDPTIVGDYGVRTVNGVTMRGLDANGTPPTSEIDATQILWIDVDTFLPRRYEFSYAMSGLGDYAYDVAVIP
jgi:hypothetical protein